MLSDVFEAVKADMQAKYPEEPETRPNGFEHLIGDESIIAYNGSTPRAIWVLPRTGQVEFDRSKVRQVGEKVAVNGRQIQAMGVPVSIHIWTEQLEDWEENTATGRKAGILTEYQRTLTKVLGGAEWEILDGGWESKTSTEFGYIFVMRVMIWFGVYDPTSKHVKIRSVETTSEFVP